MAKGGGLRERKKLATREALQHAAVRLYRLRGADAVVTVEEICAEAGVSPRTFFNYFASKDEAAFTIDPAITAIGRRILDCPEHDSPVAALRIAFAAVLTQLAESEVTGERIALLRERPELLPRLAQANRAFEEAVAAAIAERTGLSQDDLYVRVTAGAGFVAFRAPIASWPADSGADELVALMNRAMDTLEHGLVPPAA